jgi:hypothetical protein
MNTLLFWGIATAVSAGFTTYPFKTEKSVVLFRMFATGAVVGNAVMFGTLL